MTPARMRRLASDYEEVKKNFAGHRYITVTPVGDEPPEKYHVTYFVNGIYLLPDGTVQNRGRHEVDIILHADYPRYKPICRITTPIWHPNFRDGQICIGDIWGAGESLSDIIINIGNMIQYQSWNAFSPLSAEAAKWAMENKHLFPVGTVELCYSDYASAKDSVEIDLLDEEENGETPEAPEEPPIPSEPCGPARQLPPTEAVNSLTLAQPNPEKTTMEDENDFEITAEELAGIEFVPTASRMQTVAQAGGEKARVNFKTILQKGILWALIGALVGFLLGEALKSVTGNARVASMLGFPMLSRYMDYDEKADEALDFAYKEYEEYCRKNHLDAEDSLLLWYLGSDISDEAQEKMDEFLDYSDKADDALYDAFRKEFDSSQSKMTRITKKVIRVSTALWSGIIALAIGMFLGLGEGVFYGSKEKAVQYGLIGALICTVLGFLSGDLAQFLYSGLLGEDPSLLLSSLIRGIGWSIMGIGVGLAIGLIRPSLKRILFCCIGGMAGAFIGGFLFNYVCKVIPNDMIARAVAVVIMGILIGIGVGMLEQFAKQAWLKVIRGEFEGKEYLVFNGTTSIGNNGRNTIVLFKDKLVSPHHCDIVMEGGKYVIVDCGTPMGTIVNGRKISRHTLRRGDTIAVGNSVLVFNMK